MALVKTAVRFDPSLDDEFTQLLKECVGEIDDILKETAQETGFIARRTSEFEDKSGKLRNSIVVKKSKFPDGGWIVITYAEHAHLIELGHLLVRISKSGVVNVIKHVAARPFMRKAAAEGERLMIAKLRGSGNG